MNIIDKFLARIPLTEVTIWTTINSNAVMERIEYGLMPVLIKRNRGEFFTFHGSYDENYFKIQARLKNSDGEDTFPNDISVGIGFIRFPINIETSPIFYGRVFDDGDNGSIIKGHFGLPFPTLGLLLALVLLTIQWIVPKWSNLFAILIVFLILWSVMNMMEFITERKGILDFLKGLFYDVIQAK